MEGVANIEIPLGLNEDSKAEKHCTVSNAGFHADDLGTLFINCATQILKEKGKVRRRWEKDQIAL